MRRTYYYACKHRKVYQLLSSRPILLVTSIDSDLKPVFYDMYISFSVDSAVLTGTLTWVKVDSNESRTTAQFTLTLSLSHSQYPEASVGDGVEVRGALVKFGDGETNGDTPLLMEAS